MELGYILLVVFHAIIRKGMVNLLKEQLTANGIRYRTYDYITTSVVRYKFRLCTGFRRDDF